MYFGKNPNEFSLEEADLPWLKLPNNIIFFVNFFIIIFFFIKEGPNYTTSTIEVWHRKVIIAVLQKFLICAPFIDDYWCLSY